MDIEWFVSLPRAAPCASSVLFVCLSVCLFGNLFLRWLESLTPYLRNNRLRCRDSICARSST